MRILKKIIPLFALLVLISSTQGCGNADCVLTGFVNCDNGGGADKSIINGRVVDVIGGPVVSGIKVIAERNNDRVASDITNSDGVFTLRVRSGEITLRFETSTFNVFGVFTVTEDSEVFLDVNLAPDDVFVVDWGVLQDPIRCEGSKTFRIEEPDLVDFTINGGGRNCIGAKGDCIIDISVQNITLNDCNEGILAEGNANLTLEALGVPTLTIDAISNGIHTKDDSSVTLMGVDVSVTSNDSNGILATDDSNVDVIPTGDCTIEGGGKAVNEQDAAMIDPDGCTLVQP